MRTTIAVSDVDVRHDTLATVDTRCTIVSDALAIAIDDGDDYDYDAESADIAATVELATLRKLMAWRTLLAPSTMRTLFNLITLSTLRTHPCGALQTWSGERNVAGR